jgi:hypothetical protein
VLKYRAFISYSHTDQEFARRLQSWLETFEVPNDASRQSLAIRPIYRDEGAITAGSLTDAIKGALAESECLILIASDASAKSQWVAQELEFFLTARPGAKRLAIYSPESSPGTPLPRAFSSTIEGEDYIASPAIDGELLAFLRLAAGVLSIPLDAAQRHHQQRVSSVRRYFQSRVDEEIDAFVRRLDPPAEPAPARKSQKELYLRLLTTCLVDWATAQSVSQYEFEGLLSRTLSAFEDIAYALQGGINSPGNAYGSRTFWTVDIDYLLRNSKSPVIDRRGYTDAVMRYLELPFREQQFDRLLVEALVCTEYFALRDFINDPSVAWNLEPASRKAMARALKSPWLGTLRDYAMPVIYFAAIAFGVEYAHRVQWLGNAAREVLLYLIAAIAVGYAVLALIALPKVIVSNRVVRTRLDESMSAIEDVIQFLRNGEVSIAEVKRRVARAETAHVGWPSALNPLLDDLAGRYQRLWAGDR